MQTKNKRSIAKKLQTPEFKSEMDEARWYEKNQEALLTEFKNAAADGTLGRSSLAKRGLTPTTTIRLDKATLNWRNGRRKNVACGIKHI